MPRAVVFFLSFRLCVPLLSSLLFRWLTGGWILISHFTFRRFLIKIATNTHWKRNEEVFMAHAIASYINVRVLIDRWRAISLYFTLTVTIAYTIQNTNIHYFVSLYPGYGACVRCEICLFLSFGIESHLMFDLTLTLTFFRHSLSRSVISFPLHPLVFTFDNDDDGKYDIDARIDRYGSNSAPYIHKWNDHITR